jgi:ribosomal protein L29
MSKKTKEIREMSKEARASRIEELTLELAKARATSQKSSGKTKEIKKALARLFTFNRAEKLRTLKNN